MQKKKPKNEAETRAWFWDTIGAYCRRCGYSRSAVALQAHHVDASEKNGKHDTLAAVIQRDLWFLADWARRTRFIILCANCHAELHAGLWSADNYKPDNDRLGSMAWLPKDETDAGIIDNMLSEIPDDTWEKIQCHTGKSLTMEQKRDLAAYLPFFVSKIPISKRERKAPVPRSAAGRRSDC